MSLTDDPIFLAVRALTRRFGGRRGGLVLAVLATLAMFVVATLALLPVVGSIAAPAAAAAAVAPLTFGVVFGWVVTKLSARLDLAEARLQALATLDDLTEVFNRRHLLSMVQNEIERGKRFGGSFALIALAVDDFQGLNERSGRLAGDKVLQTLAATVRHHIRPIDVLARFGGAELMVLQPQADTDQAQSLASRLRDIVARTPVIVGDEVLEFSICVGLTVCSDPKRGLEPLVRRVEDALRDAQELGAGRVAVR
ncbi:MAG: GGDEF domain-containing protein [Gammaproteobacteria bacterium]|nr:GGDEF domain-containing protein [Gammaproteobacteria bacterium]